MFSLFLMISCIPKTKYLNLNSSDITKIEIIPFNSEKYILENEEKDDLISKLNESKKDGPYKYMKTHRILFFYKNGKIDTVLSNGKILQIKSTWYVSDKNYLETYK